MPAPITVVLVHGAFAESASWSGVISGCTTRESRPSRRLTLCAVSAPTPRTSAEPPRASAARSCSSATPTAARHHRGRRRNPAPSGSSTWRRSPPTTARTPSSSPPSSRQHPRRDRAAVSPRRRDQRPPRRPRLFPQQFAADVPIAEAAAKRRPSARSGTSPSESRSRRDPGLEVSAVVVRLRRRRQEHPGRRSPVHGRRAGGGLDHRGSRRVPFRDGLAAQGDLTVIMQAVDHLSLN